MNRQLFFQSIVWTGLLLALATGCQPQEPFYFFNDGDLSHYVGIASNLDVPDVDLESLDEVEGALPPLTLSNIEPESIDDLSLEEAVRISLENSKIMRNLGGVAFGPTGAQGTPSSLLSNPGGTTTILDPAITETDARFGIEAALAAFDARFSTSAFWEKNDSPINTRRTFTRFFNQVNEQDLGTFQARLSKTNATGGTTALTHNVRYEQSNNPLREPIWSDWTTNIEAEFRQPLLQGFGVQYNRIAGPGAIPGFNAGVMIARLRADTSLADFEVGVRNLVNDVERAYWNLYYAYRSLDAVTKGRDATLQTWRQVYAKWLVGGEGGGTQQEAQARQQYFQFRAAVEESQSNLFKTENILRYIMGLAATDGRLFRPSDEPSTAKANFDWYETYAEALVRSVELRRQRWAVKRADLELIAAKNYLLPRLDLIGRYRWLGIGDKLINQDDIPFIAPVGSTGEGSNAYGSMTDGDYQEWQIGAELNIPLGFRKEMSGVRNAQLTLARERAVLQEQELELQHQLQDSFRDMDKFYRVSETNFNRHEAAVREVQAVNAAYEGGTATLDLLLDAQRRMAEAENDYYRSIVDYNLAIAEFHLRKGSLLEYNGIHLAEGPWPAKAHYDARRRAKARDASFYFDYGFTRPKVISRGPYAQHSGKNEMILENEIMLESESDLPEGIPFELIPTPAPTPIDQEPSGPVQPQASRGRGGGYDLGAHLDLLAAKPQSTKPKPASGKSPVKTAGFVEPISSGSEKAVLVKNAGQWKSKRRSGPSHESHANPSTSEVSRPVTGWEGTQR